MEPPATRVTVAGIDGGRDQSIGDASDETLAELLADVAAGTLLFFIVTREDDPSEETFIQVAAAEGGHLTIEHRQGSADRHFVATSADQRLLYDVLVSWRRGSGGWESALPWRTLQTDGSATGRKPKRKWFGR